jgi:hypothetical protein
MNSRVVNKFNVPTPRPKRANDGRHIREYVSNYDQHIIRQFATNTDIAGRTKVCMLQVLSPSTNRDIKQELRMTLDGTDPSFNGGADGKSLGHIIKERRTYYLSKDALRKAKFGNTNQQTEQMRLVVLEMTH